jgi:transposase InsO family protein
VPWRESTCMSQRLEFVAEAQRREARFSALCRAYGISRKTGYKWLKRPEGAVELSRRPQNSPRKTSPAVEALVCELRRQEPVWGGRKIRHRLLLDGIAGLPAASTISDILRRHGLLSPPLRPQRDLVRFEAEQPNELWQMDFKGQFETTAGTCYPLTVLDDHSRFLVCLAACPDQKTETVESELLRLFGQYGLPRRILCDNGPPWGSDAQHRFTKLCAWLIRLGIQVSHGRPYHPQTQGKDERFHRTLGTELLRRREADWQDLGAVQVAFDLYRQRYNEYRPHQALGGIPPSWRYTASTRTLPQGLPEPVYEPSDLLRRVTKDRRFDFRGHAYRIGKAFVGQTIALRANTQGGWDVYFCWQRIARLDPSSPRLLQV